MNLTLGLYFDDESIIAAIEPFEGKFSILERRGSKKFPLFFSVENGQISYSQKYKDAFLAGNANIHGDLYQMISNKKGTFWFHDYEQNYFYLLDHLLQDVKQQYLRKLSSFVGKDSVPTTNGSIPTTFAHSDNVPVSVVKDIIPMMRQSGFDCPDQAKYSFSELFLRSQILSGKIPQRRGNYALIEALNDDLNISLIDASTGKLSRQKSKSYLGYGTDPRIKVLAEYVVKEINKNRGLIHTQVELEAEYKRHMREAVTWNERLLSTSKPFIHVKTSLSVSPNAPATIAIQRKVIDSLTRVRSSQIPRYFERVIKDKETRDNLESIVIVGDTLDNSLILDHFNRFAEGRLTYLSNSSMFDALKSLMDTDLEKPLAPLIGKQLSSLPEIISKTLAKGDKIEICWEPDRQIKAEYLGDDRFRILSHKNSKIKSGDLFTLKSIQLGNNMILTNVFRESSKRMMGTYQSKSKISSLMKIK